jgi:hypothetical protein
MTSNSYTIGPGFGPNPVFEAACAYLEAAEEVFLKETARDAEWLYVPNWFVSHHLSVIATELFLKSFHVIVSYDAADAEGPIDERYKHAYTEHKADLKTLPLAVSDDLKAHLPDELFNLMMTLSSFEIIRGRYPYEQRNDGSGCFFLPGDFGRELAANWMRLAQELKKYGKFGKPNIPY